MTEASLVGRAACALAVLALPLMLGCANRTDVATIEQPYGSYAGTVSAREYGFVKPARDVSVSGRAKLAQGGSKGDLWSRVRAGMQLNLHANARIDSTLERFRRDPRYLEKLSKRASPYLPQIVAEIERRGFPMELALLPHVESRYNPAATSPKAAGGMWQFMPYTAREMGLRLDRGYDERRDVVASTRAALKYLEQLSRRFDGDWELAMAAYNCGPGRVESAIAANRRKGKPTDFWSLDLPAETKNYVPKILADARLVAEARKYGQHLPSIPDRPGMEVIRSREPMDLVKVATTSGVDLAVLRQLNPALKIKSGQSIRQLMVPAGMGSKISAKSSKIDVIPVVTGSMSSRVAVRVHQRQPSFVDESMLDSKDHVVRNGETLASVALRHGLDLKTLADRNGMSVRDPLLPGQTLSIPTQKRTSAVLTHRVRKGDSISAIARRYGVTTADIRRWNPVVEKRFNPGDTLRIYRRTANGSS